MRFEDICEKIGKFDGVQVTSINQSVNAMGAIDGILELTMNNEHNLPQSLLDMATGYHISTSPINVTGQFAVAEHQPAEYHVTFKYDRRFLFALNHALANEEYRKANREADEFFEKFLSEDN